MGKILIAGDFYVSENFQRSTLISKDVKSYFDAAEHVILNLEAPILNKNSSNKIIKTGPHLQMLANITIPLLREFNVSGVTLANNHILDCGVIGLKETIENLDLSGIKKVGAGLTAKEIKEELILTLVDGHKIAIINFCENEFSTLSNSNNGANSYNLIENCRRVAEIKPYVKKVVCIVHGGHEYVDIPSPRMINAYRTLVDFGADAVLCHHAHCISTYEIYKEAPIFYGLGNFLFTIPSKHNSWYTGIVVELNINQNGPINCDFKILCQDKISFQLEFAKAGAVDEVMDRIQHLSELLKTPKELQNLWEKEIFALKDEYLSLVSPSGSFSNKWVISFFWRTKLFRRLFTKNYKAVMLNMIRCEAHRDALELILKENLDDRNTQ